MATRWEKEENGEYALVIDGWEQGISSDPKAGMNYMLGVDLETPGEVSVGYPITTSTLGTGTLSAPCARSTAWFTSYKDATPAGSPSFFAILDSSGQVWQSNSVAGTWTHLASNEDTTGASDQDGLAYYLGYLFKFRGGNIDYWDGSAWTNAWQTISGNYKHFAYVASDNGMYVTNGNFLASVSLTDPGDPTTFDPSSSGTYSFNAQKLQLPQTDIGVSLAEVGGGNTPQSTLLIGGIQNAIYPWDKTSASFNFPIFIADNYAYNMVSANQNAFIFAGKNNGRGRIYITNGSQAELYYKIPDYVFGAQDPYYDWGDAIFHRNNLIFGFFVLQNDETLIENFGYVWALDLTTITSANYFAPPKVFRAISPLATGATFVANATALLSTQELTTSGFGYIVGWTNNGPSPHIGYSGTAAGIGSGIVLTDLVDAGSFIYKKTFSQVEFKLRTPLQSGENITITTYIDSSNVGTNLVFSPTPTTGSISGVAPVNFQSVQWLQFIIDLFGNSTTGGVRLKEIRIR